MEELQYLAVGEKQMRARRLAMRAKSAAEMFGTLGESSTQVELEE